MMGYRLQRFTAGLLTGLLASTVVALEEVLRAEESGAACASWALLVGPGAAWGLWLGAALMGMDWSQPLSSSWSLAWDFLRVDKRSRETEKVARALSVLATASTWFGGTLVLSHTLAARIVRPTLEALAITVSAGLLAVALWAVTPALREILEDILAQRERITQRQVGVCSVASLVAFLLAAGGLAAFWWRTPIYNTLYAMDLNALAALGAGFSSSVAGMLALAFAPGAGLVDRVARPARLAAVAAVVTGCFAWGLSAPSDDAVREALFGNAPTASTVYALLRGEEPVPEAPASPSVSVAAEEDPAPAAPVPALEQPTELRHVIFLSMDTVRADHVGAYGYTRHPTTPSVDAFAAKGTRFARAYSSGPCTSASFTGMITSDLPNRVLGLTRDGDVFTLPARASTLAAQFREAGWHTRALLPVVGDYLKGIDRGFAQFDGSFHYAEVLADHAIRTLARDGETRRTFTWIHFIDAHWPYEGHKAFASFGKQPEDLYDAELAFMDQQVGRVLHHLEEAGWLKDSLVVIFSDHGEAFGEHGTRLHGNSLYDEEIHVPLIMVGPGIPVGVNPAPISLLDLGPTVRELAGVAQRNHGPMTGVSEAGLLRGAEATGQSKLAEGCKPGSMLAMIADEKLFYRKKSGLYFLYNLAADPLEKVNLFQKRADASRLAEKARQQLAGRR